MNKLFIIGIDPGKNGGIVALSGAGLEPRVIDIIPMPATISGLWDHFLYLGFPNLIDKENTYVFMEKVHSMPTDGRRAAFTFGHHLGILDTVLDRLVHVDGIHRIRPVDWQQYFGLAKDKESKESQYNFKKRILQFAKGGFSEGENDKGSKEQGKTLDAGKAGMGKRNIRVRNKRILTLKTCDAYLIALYGYHKIMEES